jgi:spoIIIJ-associated protein
MKNIEIEAKTKDEAIAKGMAELKLGRSRVSVEVIDEGGKGFLGMGSKPVKVRMRALDEGEVDPAEIVKTLLELMEVEFELQVSKQGEETDIRIDAPKDDGLLIGRRGQTLDALRHLSQRIIAARMGRNVVVNIDVGDYRARREEGLVENAKEAAASVLEQNDSVTMDPMSAQDRRVVHLALAEHEGIDTFTVGRGSRRRVVIAPADAERKDELAYDKVPDPGFRSQRMGSEANGNFEGGDTAPGRDRNQGDRDRDRGRDRGRSRNRRSRGPRRDNDERRPAKQQQDGNVIPQESTNEVDGNLRSQSSRDERSEPNERNERGERGERGGRDRDRNRGRGRGRDDRPRGRDRDRDAKREERPRDNDSSWGGESADGPAAKSKQDLSETRKVGDDSNEKAFPKDLAQRILQMESGGSSTSGKRRRRR